MSEENQIVDVVGQNQISIMRDPVTVLAEAKKAAQALMTVVAQKKKPVIMNGEQYLEFEDWQILGQFYGLSAKVVATEFVDYGQVKGWKSTAVCIRNSDGMILSSADSMCLNDEDKWSTRPKYEYINGSKEKVGDVPVPLFQLLSMSQTRACAKVFRNKLAWVAVLAGYKPTPAEEMTGNEHSVPANKFQNAQNILLETIEDITVAAVRVQNPQDRPSTAIECGCGVVVSQKVKTFSMDKFGKVLCFDCQKKQGK